MKGLWATLEFIARYPDQAAGKVAWLVAQSYELTRAEFDYLKYDLMKVWPGTDSTSRVDPGEIRVPVPGGLFVIKTKSASDPRTLAMEAPVWVIVCEAAQVSVETFENLRGRVTEAKIRFQEFGWLFLEGTFEGSLGWYASQWTKWQSPAEQKLAKAKSYSLPAWSNTFLYPGGRDDPQIKAIERDTPEDLFSEKYGGVPVPPKGRVHKSFDPLVHVRSVQYDPSLPLYLGIDPGYSGQPSTYAVEAAQLINFESGFQQWRIIDEIAVNKHAMPGFTVDDVCDIAMSRPWWKNDDKKGVIDVAGAAHAGAQESNVETWLKKTGMVLFNARLPKSAGASSIMTGIHRFDQTLKQDPVSREPGVLIDPRCRLLISELGGGPNPFDGQTHVYSWFMNQQGEVSGTTPKDEYCDGIKAFTYLDYHVRGAAYATHNDGRIRVKRRKRR